MERAQRTLAKEMGEDLLSGNHTPDLTIPKAYYVDKKGEKHEAEWQWSEENKTWSVPALSVRFGLVRFGLTRVFKKGDRRKNTP